MEDLSKKTIAKKFQFVTPDDVKRFTWVTSRFKGRVDCFELYRTVSGNEPMFEELKEWEVE